MKKHTDGPWVASDNGPAFDSYIHALKNKGDKFKFIATVPLKTNPNETRANAALIASAPELLAALEKCYEDAIRFLNEGDFKKKVKWDAGYIVDAIKKARGEL